MDHWSVRLKLEPHERLWAVRAALGVSQREMAARLGISHNVYYVLEKPDGETLMNVAGDDQAPDASIILRLCRRRSGMSASKVAKKFGVSRARYHALEKKGSRRLFEFWKKNKQTAWLAEAFTRHFDCLLIDPSPTRPLRPENRMRARGVRGDLNMTFEQFQATRRDVADLPAALGMYPDELPGATAGCVYEGDFYIEQHRDEEHATWWYCLCENNDFMSYDRAAVERFLWDALASGEIQE